MVAASAAALGLTHRTPVGLANPLPVTKFDQGGILPPGLSVALNATGRNEALYRARRTRRRW
jgi:hypothetical protein